MVLKLQNCHAEAAAFDGAYLRFTGEMRLEHYRRGVAVASVSEPALWELMYLGHARPADS